jgi:CcmD family protein
MTRFRSSLVALLFSLVATLTFLAAAHAQEFEKVEGKVVEEIPAVPFVATAYGFIWIAVLVYLLVVARGLSKVKDDIRDLRRKLGGEARPK